MEVEAAKPHRVLGMHEGGEGDLRFSGYDAKVRVKVPAGSVDVRQLRP